MGTKDKRIDAYIAKAPAFAKPILVQTRDAVHSACPACEETLKWGMPTFLHDGILCMMAAFKGHCRVRFWRGARVLNDSGVRADESWGDNGHLTDASQLPSKRVFAAYVKQAMALNESGAPSPARRRKTTPGALDTPPELTMALTKNKKAKAAYDRFPPSHKREYVEWIADAKRAETRERRIAQAVDWIAAGKSRNWKYQK